MATDEASEGNEELNMDVEYSGGQNEESPLLVAQRYLNIFHQIHIFNDQKKNEFDQSLLDMPIKIKEIVGELPGGRILLEHIDEVAEARGLEKGNKKFAKKKSTRIIDEKNNDEDEEEEDSEESKKSVTSLSAEFAKELANSLAIALRENNMIRNPTTDGVMDALNRFRAMSNPNPQVQTIVPQQPITLQEVPTENPAMQHISPNNPKTVDIVGQNSKLRATETGGQNSDLRTAETVDIDLSNILQSETLNAPKGYGNAMDQIRNAMHADEQVSLDEVNPVSLNLNDGAPQGKYSAPQIQNANYQTPQDSGWEYVDENGNPISDDGWEYVDENGNPISDDGWEYVDENGNPIPDDGWEYVDENGNPIGK
ncbi:MAG: hypothetical protein IJ525_05025 [Alphaproteobacteria bacterium]|nr:hypothetical protein [Alphaproteobacteria bacterium]